MNHMIIEQTYDYPMRMKYDPETKTFYALDGYSHFYTRGVTFPYGWLKESGTPPNAHLDVILISGAHYRLGDKIPIRLIGVFKRSDHDHKLVAVNIDRPVTDINALSADERDELFSLYPRIDASAGEGWFGAEAAGEVVSDFYANGGVRV